MSKFDARMQRLEQAIGQVDENRYWDAYLALEPQRQELYRKVRDFEVHIADFMEDLLKLEKQLPPYPKKRQSTEAEKQHAIAEMLGKLNNTRVRFLNGCYVFDEEEEIDPQEDFTYMIYGDDEPPRRNRLKE